MKDLPDFKNILIYRIGHLGDTIVALPAFWEIRTRFPDSKITLLTNSDQKNKNYITAQKILPAQGLFDSYLNYDNSAEKLSKAITYAKLFLQLKNNKFDGLFYLSTRNRTNYQIERDLKFFRAAGINKIYGTDYLKRKQLDFTETRPLPAVEPEYQFLINCLPFDKAENYSEIKHEISLTISENEKAEMWLKKHCGINFRKKKLIALAPGSKWSSKIWSEKKYLNILIKLNERFNVFPVIFGGKEDFDTGQRILSQLPEGANSAGSLTIREAFAALEKCSLYLGNDTGTMHMAAAVGTPCVVVFAATDYKGRWFPFGENNKIFRSAVECEGCHTPHCFNNHKCLELISSKVVYEACCDVLEK